MSSRARSALGLVSRPLLFPDCASSGGPGTATPSAESALGSEGKAPTWGRPRLSQPRRSQAVLHVALARSLSGLLSPRVSHRLPSWVCVGLRGSTRTASCRYRLPVRGVRRPPSPFQIWLRGDSGWGESEGGGLAALRPAGPCRGQTGCQQRGLPSGARLACVSLEQPVSRGGSGQQVPGGLSGHWSLC